MARKRNLRVVIEYDGTDFHGWQIQKDRRTVQGEFQKAVGKVAGQTLTIIGAGRTDAGVHAEGQVANFHTPSAIPARKWARALNANLPEDVSVQWECHIHIVHFNKHTVLTESALCILNNKT